MVSLAFVILVYLITLVNSQDYCQMSCDGTIHTVCERKNVNCGAAPECGSNYKIISLSDSDRQFIMDLHNQLRNKVATGNQPPQPSASNMNALSYSKELAMIAQCLSNSCKWGHDKCRKTAKYNWVGQNIFSKGYSKGSIVQPVTVLNRTIQAFYSEVASFDPSWVSSFDTHGANIAHYTQLVWANTKEVGCGMTMYVSSDGWDTYYVVCNYGPGGNIGTYPVYKTGSPASACSGVAKNPKYPGLCGPDNLNNS